MGWPKPSSLRQGAGGRCREGVVGGVGAALVLISEEICRGHAKPERLASNIYRANGLTIRTISPTIVDKRPGVAAKAGIWSKSDEYTNLLLRFKVFS